MAIKSTITIFVKGQLLGKYLWICNPNQDQIHYNDQSKKVINEDSYKSIFLSVHIIKFQPVT